MKQSGLIKVQLQEITTIKNLTSALEGVSSIRIGQIKNRVLPGRECFDELWQTYSHLRASGVAKHGRFDLGLGLGKVLHKSQPRAADADKTGVNRGLDIIITSEGKLGGAIDDRIISEYLAQPLAAEDDILTIGSHGATLLRQHGRTLIASLPFPDDINRDELLGLSRLIKRYDKITVFYQSYVSLGEQQVRKLDLIQAVTVLADKIDSNHDEDVISEQYYLFEPSLSEIIVIMESTMLQIALREVILDSQLAQLASRFTAMVAAEDKARKRHRSLYTNWRKSLRDESDRQQRELTAGANMVSGGIL